MKFIPFLLLVFLLGSINVQAQIEEEVYRVVEEMPTFPGCDTLLNKQKRKNCSDQALLKYIYQNIVYPDTARANGIQGLAVVSFTISKEGKILNPKIIKDTSLGFLFSDEAIRVVKKMNTDEIIWSPGKQRGQKVLVEYMLPIRFRLN